MRRALARLVRVEYQSEHALAELAAFAAVVDSGGFSAAARALGLRKATLSGRVRSLERRLGVSLLARTTRTLRLTDEGRAYLEHARRSLTAARAAEAAVASARAQPSGTLRVTTSPALAGMLIDAVIAPYLAQHPAVTLELDTSPHTLDVLKDGFDIAIRVGPLADSSLIARRLGTASGGYYASPAYLARHGTPRRPEDIEGHTIVLVPRGPPPHAWRFFGTDGSRRSIVVQPRLLVTSFEVAARAAAHGLGMIRSPEYFVRGHLESDDLVQVLQPWTPPGFDVHAVFPRGGALVPKTRVFIDALAAWFTARGGRL